MGGRTDPSNFALNKAGGEYQHILHTYAVARTCPHSHTNAIRQNHKVKKEKKHIKDKTENRETTEKEAA